MSKRVFLTGGTGFVGTRLVAALRARGDRPVVLSRSAERARAHFGDGTDDIDIVEGDPTEPGPWQERLAGCDAVVSLAGEPVDGRRWNAQVRQILHDSRVDTTRFVVEGMAALPAAERPAVLASASGVDYYPLIHPSDFDADEEVTEDTPPGESFLSRMCLHWEHEAEQAEAAGVRAVYLRTGLVLGRGGPFERMLVPFRWYVGGPVGSGEQWTSWIHVDDAAGAYLFALDHEALRGPVNLVAPENARNRELARAIGAALGRPSWLRVPAFAVKLALGQLAEHVVKGRRTVPAALLTAGYEFRHRELDAAVADAIR